jgi:hypothetical protein
MQLCIREWDMCICTWEFVLIMQICIREFVIIMQICTCAYILCWRNSLFLGAIISLCLWSKEGSKNATTLVRAMVMSIIIVLGVRTPMFGCCDWLAIMLFNMMICVAPAA